MNRFFAVLMALQLMMATSVLAKTDFKVGNWMLADDNIFRNYSGQGDMVFMPYAQLGYVASVSDYSSLRFGYDGDFYLFNEMSHRDFSVHSGNFSYSRLWPESNTLLSMGASVESRLNPSDYSYYNYTTGGVYGSFKYYLRDDLMMLARYNLVGKKFKEFDEFNFAEQVFDIRVNHFLPSRTTLSVNAAYYNKSYTSDVETLDSTFVSAEDITGGMGMMGPFGGRGRGMGGRLEGFLPEDFEGFYRYDVRAERFASTSQLRLGASVAQNVAEGTGLMLAYTARINPHSRNRYLTNLGESVINNEELFDDHYSYNGHEAKVQLRQMLPGKSMLTLLFTARSRKYSGRPAYDLYGFAIASGASRLDKAILFTAQYSRSVTAGWLGALESLDVVLQGGAGRNSSNDEYYDYKSAWFSLGVEKGF
jgi:hypothetical protein